MTANFDVIVLGVGAMGSATCSELARRGVRVLGLERFDVPHGFGSSGGQSRLIRKAYFEHPDYVPILHLAYRLWDELGERTGQRLLHRTGLVCAGPPGGELIDGILLAARQHAIRVERCDAGVAAERCPPLRVPEGFEVLFEADAGFVLAERAVAAHASEAMRHGAVIRARERVVDWRTDGAGVVVTTDRGRYGAGRLVLTAGAWAPVLVGRLGISLEVTRQVIGWLAPRQPRSFEFGAFPCWAIEDDAPGFTGLYYGFPALPPERFAGPLGAKVGHHHRGSEVDPERVERTLLPGDEAGFRAGLRRFLPDADGPLLAAHVCLYTMTRDGHFVIDVHPEHPQVVVACGFSGHGFKFAPAIGVALADLALRGATDLPIGFLGLAAARDRAG